jgi:putative membrane protein (TIGR04086 family)
MPKDQKLQTEKRSKANKSIPNEPWIPMRNGVIIITITSIVMAGLTTIQVAPSRGWIEGLLWGLLFGGLIWVIFFGLIFVNRFLRR